MRTGCARNNAAAAALLKEELRVELRQSIRWSGGSPSLLPGTVRLRLAHPLDATVAPDPPVAWGRTMASSPLTSHDHIPRRRVHHQHAGVAGGANPNSPLGDAFRTRKINNRDVRLPPTVNRVRLRFNLTFSWPSPCALSFQVHRLIPPRRRNFCQNLPSQSTSPNPLATESLPPAACCPKPLSSSSRYG